MKQLTFIVAGDPDQFTGGYIYDARMVDGLRKAGWPVALVGLDGTFPDPDVLARQALERALATTADNGLVVIDGLAMGGLPEVVQAHRHRLRIVCLLHHLLADEHGLSKHDAQRLFDSERAALAAVDAVIVTSRYTATRLADLDVDAARIAIVEPGIEPVVNASSSFSVVPDSPPNLLCVASVIPRKGHLVLIDALARLADLEWQCECIGALDRDRRHAAAVRQRIDESHLAERVVLAGERTPEETGMAYGRATLFVLPSYFEGYGMVVTEALAHGLPVVTTTGGALAHTLPPDAGFASDPGDAMALAANLRRLLEDRVLLASRREGALRAAASLPDWSGQAARFALVLEQRFDGAPA